MFLILENLDLLGLWLLLERVFFDCHLIDPFKNNDKDIKKTQLWRLD